jgi:hypothetical protein
LLAAAVRAFLFSTGDAYARLPASTRAGVADEVVAFVDAEVRALPRRLRLLFSLGLLGFAVAVRLRHPRGFLALPPAVQAQTVEAWAFGPLSAPRKLFRLVRSTSLLAFYDHPAVDAALGAPSRRVAPRISVLP